MESRAKRHSLGVVGATRGGKGGGSTQQSISVRAARSSKHKVETVEPKRWACTERCSGTTSRAPHVLAQEQGREAYND